MLLLKKMEKNLRKRQNPESRATSQILIVFTRSLPDGGLLGRGLAQSTDEDPSPEMMAAVNDRYLTTSLIDTGAQILMIVRDAPCSTTEERHFCGEQQPSQQEGDFSEGTF
ncbi:hypothetical protein AV530_012468 [Patagioenas fasciata monilis]|uniref:Uncharacterized protein n=1 Tax=Patagioenas fasciata monilis TaxID=372326 RepID=A0A1V4JBK0_PATFA|nr:hypothetical protein AV530_012468 [Patagioenas fasciata monilis]